MEASILLFYVFEIFQLEIEVVNIDNPSSEILLGKANGNLRHLIPHFNQETQIVLPLAQRDGSYRGEIHIKAIVTEMETALGMFFLIFFLSY